MNEGEIKRLHRIEDGTSLTPHHNDTAWVCSKLGETQAKLIEMTVWRDRLAGAMKLAMQDMRCNCPPSWPRGGHHYDRCIAFYGPKALAELGEEEISTAFCECHQRMKDDGHCDLCEAIAQRNHW